MHVPQFTLDDYEKVFADRHLLHGVVAKWAKAKPEAPPWSARMAIAPSPGANSIA